jgi:hypothetical protein
MNRLNMVLAALALGLSASSASAQVERASRNFEGYNLSEYVLESASVRLYMRNDVSGTAVARECTKCPPLRLRVTSNMAVVVDGQPLEWNASLNLKNQLVDVFYDVQSKNINRLVVQ